MQLLMPQQAATGRPSCQGWIGLQLSALTLRLVVLRLHILQSAQSSACSITIMAIIYLSRPDVHFSNSHVRSADAMQAFQIVQHFEVSVGTVLFPSIPTQTSEHVGDPGSWGPVAPVCRHRRLELQSHLSRPSSSWSTDQTCWLAQAFWFVVLSAKRLSGNSMRMLSLVRTQKCNSLACLKQTSMRNP